MAGESYVVVKNLGTLTQSDGTTTGSGYSSVGLDTLIAGERNPSSATASYLVVSPHVNATILHSTDAEDIGAGAANDTLITKIIIKAASTAVTCTLTGLFSEDDAATTFVFSGNDSDSNTATLTIDLDGAINPAAKFTAQASAADSVIVCWRAV
jgi:hypothetical protein